MNLNEIQLLYIYVLIFKSLFMLGFLQEVAQDLISKKGNAIAQCHLVFPSQRAKTAFYQGLIEYLAVPVWKPKSLGMDELIASLSDWKIPSHIELLALLYQSYTELMNLNNKTAESFDQFYSWGEIMLADFDAIDKQNLDAETVLGNIEDLKNIDELFHSREIEEQVRSFWESSIQNPNEQFLQTWKILHPLYMAFHEKLAEKGWAYAGMQYKNAVQNLDTFESEAPYIFIGFNALNPCESAIFDHLQTQGALFYWDCDEYYLRDGHEAGIFMSENLKRYGNALPHTPSRISGLNHIRIYAAESDILQCKLAGSLAKGKTAIVLVNEQLLIPCIHSIPTAEQMDLNITMGYPFRLSPTYAWIKDWIQLCLGSARLEHNACEHHYFSKDLLQFFDHEAISGHLNSAESLKREILKSKRRIFSVTDLFDQDIPDCFLKINSGTELLSRLIHLIDQILFRMVRNPQYTIEGFEALSFVYEQLQILKKAIDNTHLEMSVLMTAKLIQKHLNALNMTLESDRNSELQIMGFLETRAMDFENVIILSANDDLLPGNTHSLSFIPFSIRRAFGLPTHKEKEAMYAYYFFRLLQRSHTVHLIYNNSTAYNNSGEMSRYLQQIQMEIMEQPMTIEFVSLQTRLLNRKPLVYAKTGKLWEDFVAKPLFSASSWNDYLECTLRFYFKKIAKIKEPDKLVSEVDGSIFGNIIHQTIRLLYEPFGNEIIAKKQLENLYLNTKLQKEALRTIYQANGLSKDFGEGAMLESIFLNFIQRIIRYDKDKRREFSIYSMEAKREPTEIIFNIAGTPKTLYWNAAFDRIDQENGQWIVVDYKTGKPPEMNKLVANMEDLMSGKFKEARQTLLYTLLMEKDGHVPAKPLLYFVQKMHLDQYNAEIEIRNTEQPSADFFEEMEKELNIFFNPEIPFSPCKDSARCTYCPYIHLCEPQITVYDA